MGSKNKKQKKGETSNEAKLPSEMVKKKIKKQNDGGEEKAAAKGSSSGGFIGDPMISDPRFSSAHTDPRFRRLPRREAKVTLDSRFRGVLTETASAPVDKRGKKRRKGSGKDSLREFYRIDEEEEDNKRKKDESESESEEEMKDLKAEMKRRKSEEESKSEKLKLASSSSDEESESEEVSEDEEEESEEIDTDEDDEAMYEEEEDGFEIPEEEITNIDKETHRLAVVNMDWTHVSAKDLYMVFNSFIPKDGRILSVSVYPSQLGLERMKEEEIHGPKIEIDKKNEGNDDSSEEEEDEEVINQKLRAYEITRLKYYFAVVECDSAATADFLYKSCDGIEFERSSNKLDLRFIPDTTVFEHPPRDTATEAPTNYEGLDFQTGALQMSKVNLSWDDDEPHRVKTLNQKFKDDQLAALEMKEYIASSGDDDESESDNEEDENVDRKEKKGKEKYRALLESNKDDDEDDDDEENGKNDEGMDMEVTFNTGLEDLSKQVREKKDQKESESLWDKYLRERCEKKRAKKKNKKNDDSSDDDNQVVKEDGDDDFFMEEPKPSLKKKKEEVAVEEERSRAELELLLADDDGEGGEGLKGYNIKKKGSKKGSSKEIASEAMTELDEPRFAMKLADPLYALDPTDPQFKRSGTYVRQLAQKQMEVVDPTKMEKEAKPESKKTERHETSTAVKSVKMKMKNQQKDSEKQKKTGNAESSSSTALSKKLKKKLEDMSKK